MKSFHGERLSQWDIELYRQLIFVNLLSILEYLTCVTEQFELDVSQDITNLIDACPYIDLEDDQPFPVAYRDILHDLWVSTGMQVMYESGSLPELPENWLYFSQHLDRLFHAAYVPTQEDIVHAYSKTTGIAEAVIHLPSRPDVYLRLIDAGGRRSERKKWIHVFHNISVVVFLANLNGYNQTLAEDGCTNSLMEDMNLWKAVCNSRWFTHASLILLLNKNDLFEKTLKRVPIKEYFPDYDGEPGDASDGRKYFLQRFRSVTQRRDTYCHLTTATDLSTFRYVMTALEGAQTYPALWKSRSQAALSSSPGSHRVSCPSTH
ncbi:heterotrimeric G protein alpha subunit 4 [Fomes fomentarius]|nr:heterotrimeric G protein alpha subunit 4 [Fomes fomentarius]